MPQSKLHCQLPVPQLPCPTVRYSDYLPWQMIATQQLEPGELTQR